MFVQDLNLIIFFPGFINFEAKMDPSKFLNTNDITLAFHKACINDDLHLATSLLSNKGEIDVIQIDEMETLFKTVKRQHSEIVKLLLEIGVDVNQPNWLGKTVLHYNCEFDSYISITHLLIENGASINSKDHYESTPLHTASLYDNLGTVQTLLNHKADVNATEDDGTTPLHNACMFGYLDIVKELLKHQANINAISYRHRKLTPLMLAAEHGHLEVVEELLKNGANIDSSDYHFGTSLHLAIDEAEPEIVKTLLDNGCNINVRARIMDENQNLVDFSAFELALGIKSIHFVKLITFHDA